MSKPLGISLTVGPEGPRMSVRQSSRAQDKIWDAVEEAIIERMTPEQFIREARQSWAESLRQQARCDDQAFAKAKP